MQGAEQAGERVANMEEFKKAQTVKINPDKPQEHCRFKTLEVGQNVLVFINSIMFE